MKFTRHKITFTDATDIEAVALSQLGISDAAIERETGLSVNQVRYRITKAKNADGMRKGETYRTHWKDGTSNIAQAVIQSVAPGLRRDIKRTFPRRFVHPTPEAIGELQRAA